MIEPLFKQVIEECYEAGSPSHLTVSSVVRYSGHHLPRETSDVIAKTRLRKVEAEMSTRSRRRTFGRGKT
jgi:hypothetical protein